MTLKDLNAEIIHVNIDNESILAILFDCPVNCGYKHMIPFWDKFPKESDGKIKIWHRISGSTIEDLSISPSYVSPIPTPTKTSHIHFTLINGELK